MSGSGSRGLGMRRCPGEAMNEVVGRPGAGNLHLAFAHDRAGRSEFVLIALHVFAVDQVGDIEHHFAALGKAAAHFFIQRHEEPVHLEADGAGTGLAFTGAGGVLAQVAQVLPAYALGRLKLLKRVGATIVDKDLEVHLRFAAQLVDVSLELALVGADGLAEALIVVEHGAEAEGKHGGMLEAVGDDSCVVPARLLIEGFRRVMFTDNNGKVAGGVKKYLIATYSDDGLHRNWFTMTG